MQEQYEKYLLKLHASSKYRKLGFARQEDNVSFLDFSTNDYLNLSQNSQVINAATQASLRYGCGATGSRLLSGNLALYEEFEERIAKDKNTQAALIFNSGFQANITTLSSLLDEKILQTTPIVFFDRLNHSSLYQAVFLSKAQLCRYKHNDMNDLEALLEQYKTPTRAKFIVTETIFGMDGDITPIEQIADLARKYGTFLYLDEAHATGVFGHHGYGFSSDISLQDIPCVIMGTFSKALGSSGAYIACSKLIKEFLINKAPGFIYSTAPSPGSVAAAFQAWKIVKDLGLERQNLQSLGSSLRAMLRERGFDTGPSNTHIVPIILKEEKYCLDIQAKLLKKNIIVSSIRPPTIPPGSSRLRVALRAKHTLSDIEKLVQALDD